MSQQNQNLGPIDIDAERRRSITRIEPEFYDELVEVLSEHDFYTVRHTPCSVSLLPWRQQASHVLQSQLPTKQNA